MFLRSGHTFISFGVLASILAACTLVPTPIKLQPGAQNQLANTQVRQAMALTDASEPATLTFTSKVVPQTLEQTATLPSAPSQPTQSLDFVTGAPTAQQIKMPLNGSFKVIYQAGPGFQIIDNDATDGTARVQMPSQTFDLYLRPEPNASVPSSCPTPAPTSATGSQLFDQLDQAVLAKANQLVSAGQSQCTYLPPSNQRQNGNCNSTSTGFQCSGALNKTISAASCPEIAIYGGAMNINNSVANSKLWVAMQNNLTINQSVRGIFSSRGDLNTSLNNSAQLSGVFVGARSNLNLSGSAKLQGLYAILNNGSLSMNLNPSGIVEGEVCSTGTSNINRNGNSQLIYNPNQITAWLSDLPMVGGLMCSPGSKPYTQTVAQSCPTPVPSAAGSLKVEDKLYYVDQTLSPTSNGQWYKMPGRPMPIPSNWRSADGSEYALTLTNSGVSQISSRWVQTQQESFPVGTKKIGPAGGTIDFPGIGKLVIPSGALTQEETIIMKQVFSAKELFALNPETGEYYLDQDYISPVVSIEPHSISLTKGAELFLETNLERLGQNSPGFITWATSDSSPIQDYFHLDPKIDGLPITEWTPNLPVLIHQFGVYFKLIPTSVTASGKKEMKIFTIPLSGDASDSEGFSTQAQNQSTTYYMSCVDPDLPPDLNCTPADESRYQAKAEDIAIQLNEAYKKYLLVTGFPPPKWYKGGFLLEFQPGGTKNSKVSANSASVAVQNKTKGSSKIYYSLGRTAYDTAPHEMWHVFQFANYNAAEYDFSVRHSRWVYEGSAAFAGGYLTQKYASKFQPSPNNYNVFAFLYALDFSNQYLNISFLEDRVAISDKDKNYNASAFFTYLSHPGTGVNQKTKKYTSINDADLKPLAFVADLADAFNNASGKHNNPELDVDLINERLAEADNTSSEKNRFSEYYLNFIPHSFKGGRYSSNQFVFAENTHLLKHYMKQHTVNLPINHGLNNPYVAYGTYSGNQGLSEFLPCLTSIPTRIQSSGRQLSKGQNGTSLIIFSNMAPKSGYVRTHIFYEFASGAILSDYLPNKHRLKSNVPKDAVAINIVTSNAEWRPCKKSSNYTNPELKKHRVITEVYYDDQLAIKGSRLPEPEEERVANLPVGKQIVLRTSGVETNDDIVFESKANGTILVKPKSISNRDPDTGEQDVLVEYPQEAKEHGWVQIVTEDDESNQLNDVAVPCWALVAGNDSFDIATDRQSPCKQN